MRKKDELNPEIPGCLQKASEDEMLFVLRAQDKSAPKIIFKWIAENLESLPDDKIAEAVECALVMREHSRRKNPD